MLDGVFGIYALGLLPGLLTGGALSDRVGRAVVVLPGALIASLGTLILLLWHDAPGLMVGRLVVGIGAGLAIGAGTAWAADLRGKSGTVMAGVVLTSGFALGPLFSGLLAQFAAFPLATPFVVSAFLSVGSVTAAAVWSRTPVSVEAATITPVPDGAERSVANAPDGAERSVANAPDGAERSVANALLWALPLAPWVFASATVSFVTMTARLGDRYSGPLLPGFAAALTLGAGILVQTAARHRNWGPQAGTTAPHWRHSDTAWSQSAARTPALGLFIVCALVLGTAYGLCLREGLLDLESLAPPRPRGRPDRDLLRRHLSRIRTAGATGCHRTHDGSVAAVGDPRRCCRRRCRGPIPSIAVDPVPRHIRVSRSHRSERPFGRSWRYLQSQLPGGVSVGGPEGHCVGTQQWARARRARPNRPRVVRTT